MNEAHFETLRDGVVLGNVGHFPFEIDVPALARTAVGSTAVTDAIDAYELASGRTVNVLAGGRMFNLAGAAPKGNSIESMDVGFMLQALSLERLAVGRDTLPLGPHCPPHDIEQRIARALLAELDSSS